ncbi:MAG TPA: hypothetical protein VJ747_10305 [Stellaceae bacterium]|nr:hypothetical protein [Stellaceae bacterium]
MANLDLALMVRGVDALLRQRQHIREFTADNECLFRVAVAEARASLHLSDETFVRLGDPILELHFWNEHVPPMPADGPSAAWANLMKRLIRRSLVLTALYLEQERALASIVALHGAPPFRSRVGTAQMLRAAKRFGFDVVQPDAPGNWRSVIHEVLDGILIWALLLAFNPSAQRGDGMSRHRYHLWISRRKLLCCFGQVSGTWSRL